jgi:hypothetical protein
MRYCVDIDLSKLSFWKACKLVNIIGSIDISDLIKIRPFYTGNVDYEI